MEIAARKSFSKLAEINLVERVISRPENKIELFLAYFLGKLAFQCSKLISESSAAARSAAVFMKRFKKMARS